MDIARGKLVATPRKYSKNNIVLFQGEVPRYAFLVKAGYLKIYSLDDEGNEKIVGICSEGDIFPLNWLLGYSRSTVFYYEAFTECLLIPMTKAEYNGSETLRQYLNERIGRDSATSLLRDLALQQSSAANKIMHFFYFLAMRYGSEKKGGLFSLGIPMTHQFIANNLGLTRETVATEIGQLKKRNIVMYRHKHYIVDKTLVLKTVGKEISNNFEN